MRIYKKKHKYYCGVDLHTRRMYVCIVNHEGETLVHRNIPAKAKEFLTIIEPYVEDLAVAAECMFTWYWLADVCHGCIPARSHWVTRSATSTCPARSVRAAARTEQQVGRE